MRNAIRWLIAIVATVAGACATVAMLVLIVAAAPNSGEAQTLRLERMSAGVVAVGAASAIGAFWLAVRGRTRPAAWVGLIPLPICAFLLAAWLASHD